MIDINLHGVTQFLVENPGMSIVPSRSSNLNLKGKFNFVVKLMNEQDIADSYFLEISIPEKFPSEIPVVREIGKKLPRDGNYHINSDDSLCLGSPIRLLKEINAYPNIVSFTEKCLVPHLCAASRKLKCGGSFIFGELDHGTKGIISEYLDLFGLKTSDQVVRTLELLELKKRRANKKPCPCGCGRRLGSCPFHEKINAFRKMTSSSWFKAQKETIRRYMGIISSVT